MRLSKADVSAIIWDHESKRQKEADEQGELKDTLVNELAGLVKSQVAAALASIPNQRRTLQRAGTTANVASTDADALGGDETKAAERCALSLLKFSKIGSKAQSKAGH